MFFIFLPTCKGIVCSIWSITLNLGYVLKYSRHHGKVFYNTHLFKIFYSLRIRQITHLYKALRWCLLDLDHVIVEIRITFCSLFKKLLHFSVIYMSKYFLSLLKKLIKKMSEMLSINFISARSQSQTQKT